MQGKTPWDAKGDDRSIIVAGRFMDLDSPGVGEPAMTSCGTRHQTRD